MAEQKKKKREFPEFFTAVQTFLTIFQSLMLILYTTGAWQVNVVGKVKQLDNWDVGIATIAIMAGPIMLMISYFQRKYYEVE